MNKADLFKPRIPEGTVETVAGTVRVRGLSRAEVMELKKHVSDPSELDVQMLARAMVDPVLTVDEAREWCRAWPENEIEPVSDKIAELSGMAAGPEAEEAREASFRGEPGESV